jgi:type II secretory pathway component PulJ
VAIIDRQRSGLSTIEVLVAVALIGMALLPLIAVQSQIAQTHARYEAAYQRATLQRNALEITRNLNPLATPEGRVILDDQLVLEWSSEPVRLAKRGTDYPLGDGPFEVGLYRVSVSVLNEGRVELEFTTEKVGWRLIEGEASDAGIP